MVAFLGRGGDDRDDGRRWVRAYEKTPWSRQGGQGARELEIGCEFGTRKEYGIGNDTLKRWTIGGARSDRSRRPSCVLAQPTTVDPIQAAPSGDGLPHEGPLPRTYAPPPPKNCPADSAWQPSFPNYRMRGEATLNTIYRYPNDALFVNQIFPHRRGIFSESPQVVQVVRSGQERPVCRAHYRSRTSPVRDFACAIAASTRSASSGPVAPLPGGYSDCR